MSTSFGIEYPLQRDGNSQAQRNPEARNPDFAPVEGRNVLDLLHFWAEYAKLVLHYDNSGVQRDWSPFFDNSVPFKLAEIYQADPEKWWTSYQDFRNKTDSNANDGLELVTGHLFAAFEQHQTWHQVLAADFSKVSLTVKNLTETNLRSVLFEFTGIFNALQDPRYGLASFQSPAVFFSGPYLDLWQLRPNDIYYTDPALTAKIGNRTTILPHLLPRLDRLAEILYKSQLAIQTSFPDTEAEIEKLIAPDGYHDPMIGLMLAFLELFRVVQTDFNRLTERHLNYFYSQVLQLAEKAPIPDAAHLVLELAKHVPDAYRLLAGTAFKDGKDANKTDVVFNTTDELVVNRATVGTIRTLFFGQEIKPANLAACPPDLPPANLQTGKPYISDPALTDFSALGSGQSGDTLGRMGFVLPSPLLRLAEGTRNVMVEFSFDNPINPPLNFKDLLKPEVTIKDKWIPVTDFQTHHANSSHAFSILFTLTPDVKPLEALNDSKLNPFGGDQPLLKVAFEVSNSNFNAFYQQLEENNLTGITITVQVTDVQKQTVLKNEEGDLNAQKPFQPFGTNASNRFYISHPDFEGKELTNLVLKIKFDGDGGKSRLESIYNMYPNVPFDRTNVQFSSALIYDNFTQITPLKPAFPLFHNNSDDLEETVLPLNAKIKIPFADAGISLKLNGDPFLFNEYPNVLARQSEAARNFPGKVITDAYYFNKTTQALEIGSANPNSISATDLLSHYEVRFPKDAPCNPKFESFSFDYDATGQITTLIQLLPFEDSTETVIIGQKVASTQTPARLVPYIPMEGHLYIGIKDAPKSGNLALLFQFSEYTGNPDLKLPVINWSILTEGHLWKPLQKDVDYTDDTQGFVQSGIIRFELPEKVSTVQTILSPNLSWLRAEVPENADAFDHLTGILAQAVKVVFAPVPANDLMRLNEVLEAGKIKKLIQEAPNIGKIDQPYQAFGGRSAEDSEAFYRRVSEHLRHKGRAVSLWDYESLVLEAFPQIYKVKCLNHTLGLRGMSLDFEFMNGFVTVVVIPDVRKLDKSRRDQPKANQNLLQAVKDFLKDRVSPFVRLDVQNPRYETVDAIFNVRFFPGKDDAYYKELLTTEIKDFLSPWRTDPSAEIQFGGEVFRSSIVRFIEQREYVDYVTDFILNHDPVLNSVQAQTARSVLAAGIPDITVI